MDNYLDNLDDTEAYQEREDELLDMDELLAEIDSGYLDDTYGAVERFLEGDDEWQI